MLLTLKCNLCFPNNLIGHPVERRKFQEVCFSANERTSSVGGRKLPTRNTIREITIVKEGGRGNENDTQRSERTLYLIHISAFHDDGKKAKKGGLPLPLSFSPTR